MRAGRLLEKAAAGRQTEDTSLRASRMRRVGHVPGNVQILYPVSCTSFRCRATVAWSRTLKCSFVVGSGGGSMPAKPGWRSAVNLLKAAVPEIMRVAGSLILLLHAGARTHYRHTGLDTREPEGQNCTSMMLIRVTSEKLDW